MYYRTYVNNLIPNLIARNKNNKARQNLVTKWETKESTLQ